MSLRTITKALRKRALAIGESSAMVIILLQLVMGTVGDLILGLVLMAIVFGTNRAERWADKEED